jgi:hypothetical protein
VVRHAAIGLEHQRIQEQHAELAVAGPWLVLPQPLERADVDEHRARPAELHVVGRGVLEREVVREREAAERELEQRRVLEHRERPLVGIGDPRDALVLERAGGGAGGQLGQAVELRRLGGDEPLVGCERRGGQRLPVAPAVVAQGAVDRAVVEEDTAVWIAE